MIKVVGTWEFGYSTPLAEFDQWNFPLRDFGCDEFIMWPVTGIQKKVTEYNTLDEALDANPDLTVVCVDENGAIPLAHFEHPENAIYVLGKAGYSCMNQREVHQVRIEHSVGRLWPHQCMAILLYDRLMKEKGSV